jgi:hypothetical protein
LSGEQPTRRPGLIDVACLAIAAPLVVTHAMFTHDLWWHLSLGDAILRDHAIPAVETFSYTAAGTPLTVNHYSWLADVAFAALDKQGGLGLVEIAGALLVALTLRIVHAIGCALGAAPVLAAGGAFAFALSSAPFLILRPLLFTYLGFAWLLLAAIEWRAGRSRMVLAAPIVILVWANLHGGFLLGIAFLLGVAALDAVEGKVRGDAQAVSRARTLALLGVASIAASCVQPLGVWSFIEAITNSISAPLAQYIDEWRAPDLASVPLLGVGAVAAIAIALALPSPPPIFEAAGVLGTLFLALNVWRHIPLFGIAGAPILAAWATRALAARAPAVTDLVLRSSRILRGSLAGGAALLLLTALALGAKEIARPTDILSEPALTKRYPVQATRFVERENLRGPMFNSYRWGGFLIRFLPSRRVFIDSRMVPYVSLYREEYAPIWGAHPEWRDLLARRQVAWAILEKDARLVPLLRLDPDWKLVYSDETAEVFARRDGPNAHVAEITSGTR